MTSILIDSDVLIDYVRGIPATITHLQQLQASGAILCTCDVVIAEVEAGLNPVQSASARQLVDELVLLGRGAVAARMAGRWRYDYARKGVGLSTPDTLIAATAVSHAASLLTRNLSHYPMPELSVLAGPSISAR